MRRKRSQQHSSILALVHGDASVLHRDTKCVGNISIANTFRLCSLLRVFAASHSGVGLAANQVGIDLAVAVMVRNDGSWLELINPSLELKGEEVESIEGCLSFSGQIRTLMRYPSATVTTYDNGGERISLELDGFEAIIAQHEIDHLHGITIVDGDNSTSCALGLARFVI